MTTPEEANVTALQEAPYRSLYELTGDIKDFNIMPVPRTALAQQGLPQKERPDFMAGYDAGMADAKRMAQQGEQQPVCHGCGIPAGDVHMSTCKSGKWPSRVSNGDTAAPVEQRCTYCDGTGDVHSIDGEWRGTCHCAAAPAPQPAQGVPETNFGNMPVKFLVNGTRFKLSFDTRGRVSSLWNFMDELDGRWVALVAAEDDCHLQSAQPKQEPLTDGS